ncbi:hypothetical protein B296_00045129 [Ensete ventricosum]|uniref:Hexosyltransferase n=1 Tax=Ensete ventricosum TaxID=4639 RepID=A0A426Y1G4_ENSVE|nr:hypothetical protein B296_00045129 [Ensete ventricosum]
MIFSDCFLLVPKTAQLQEGSSEQTVNVSRERIQLSIEYNQQSRTIDPIKLRRQVISALLPIQVSCIFILKAHGVFCLQKLRDERRERRIADLIHMSKETELQMQKAAIERAKEFNNTRRAWYSIWRKEYTNPHSDTTLKLMRDQKIMAKVYASVAYSTGEHDLYNSLMRHIKEIRRGIGDANSDSELQERYLLLLLFFGFQNEDRMLWKLGSLPPGLITFYNLTYPLDRSWHVLGLGYDPAVNPLEIESASVIHYNGNYKPWLDLAFTKYKPYWSKFVNVDNPYIQDCYSNQ